MACDLVPGVDYDEAVCDNCGRDHHTKAQLKACYASIVCPPPCPTCGARDVRVGKRGDCEYCR